MNNVSHPNKPDMNQFSSEKRLYSSRPKDYDRNNKRVILKTVWMVKNL